MTRDMKASKEIMGDQVEGLPRKQSKKHKWKTKKKNGNIRDLSQSLISKNKEFHEDKTKNLRGNYHKII